MENKTLTKNAGKTAFGTTISRMLGYIRDMLIANAFGAGMFADAFYAAFRIPNLFRRMLGEGSFSAAFIPVFSQYLHTKEKSEVQKMLSAVFTALFLLLIVIVILGMFFSPQLVKIIAWGFTSDPEKMALTIELTRLMFPFIFFICLAAFLLAVLNTLYSFFLPALAPASLSFSEIFYVLIFVPLIVYPQDQIKGLAIAVIAGGALHFLIQLPNLKKLGYSLKFKINLKHPAIKKIVFLMIPSLIGLSVDQINAFVDNICASFLDSGSITAMYYSNRVMQLPLAIFGLALASVSLPAMSKAAALKDMDSIKNSLDYSIRFSLFTLIPAAIGLMLIGFPIIRVLFERGRFDLTASLMTNSALFYYSLGLPAYAAAKLYANVFYSFQDTKTPVKTAAAAMFVHVILCVLLMYRMGVGGLALATAASSYLNLFLLAYYLRKKIGRLGVKNILVSGGKTLISSILAGASAYFVSVNITSNIYIAVFLAIMSAIIVFLIMSKLLNSQELNACIAIIKRRR
ncbi:MAG: murein biosynthesis integral membrane protein MurJ [Elusimicrobiota bacterium]|nr:murein biosynthesis integral membrane protein MurJ [Elusimicrobiota bacterium]